MNIKKYQVREIIKTFELGPITVSGEGNESLKFKIEIAKINNGRYQAHIYRRETFRVQPTFPQQKGRPKLDCADHELFIKDTEIIDFDDLFEKTWQECLKKTLKRIDSIFQTKKSTQ